MQRKKENIYCYSIIFMPFMLHRIKAILKSDLAISELTGWVVI